MKKELPGRTSKEEQRHWKAQEEVQSPESVGAIIVSTYKSLRAELLTHIKGAGYTQQPLKSHIL